jgi:hypothetical protein
LVEAILEGADALALNTKLKTLEGQKAALKDKLMATPDAEHCSIRHWRRSIATRSKSSRPCFANPTPVARPSSWSGACRHHHPHPVDGRLSIERRGDLAGILAISEAGKDKTFSAKEKALQIKLVAGARNHLYRTRLHYTREARE